MKENKTPLKNKKETTAQSKIEKPKHTALHEQTRQLNRDTRDAILVVSVFTNVFIFTAWLVLEVSNRYDAAVINYLLSK